MLNWVNLGGGGQDRTADLRVMNPSVVNYSSWLYPRSRDRNGKLLKGVSVQLQTTVHAEPENEKWKTSHA